MNIRHVDISSKTVSTSPKRQRENRINLAERATSKRPGGLVMVHRTAKTA